MDDYFINSVISSRQLLHHTNIRSRSSCFINTNISSRQLLHQYQYQQQIATSSIPISAVQLLYQYQYYISRHQNTRNKSHAIFGHYNYVFHEAKTDPTKTTTMTGNLSLLKSIISSSNTIRTLIWMCVRPKLVAGSLVIKIIIKIVSFSDFIALRTLPRPH